MTQETWLKGVEKASGMSRQQLFNLGLEVKQLTCRRLECKGWHFVKAEPPSSPEQG